MQHVVFALFEGRKPAHRAVDQVRTSLAGVGGFDVVIHRTRGLDFQNPIDRQKLDVDETDAAPALVRGLLLGTLVGAGLGFALSFVFGMAPLVMLGWGALYGALLGGLGAALIGAGLPDRRLNKVAKPRTRQVLVTFKTSDARTKEAITAILREGGAQVADKAPV